MISTKRLPLLKDKADLVALVGVEVFDSHLLAAIAFFEKGLEKEQIIVTDESGSTVYGLVLPLEALGLRGRSRVFNLKLTYAAIHPEPIA
jgi:hypothetical protein